MSSVDRGSSIGADHPNTVKLLQVYEDSAHYCLVMELMTGGELFDHIIEKETFDEEMA